MNRPDFSKPLPADLAMCNVCRKVAGDYGGQWGPECRCNKATVEKAWA